VLAGGLEKTIEQSVREANPEATATVLSINGTPVDGRRLAAADVAFEVHLPQFIEEGGEAPTGEEAGAAADSAFTALAEAVSGDEFAALLSTSMEEAAEELVESGEVDEAEVAALVESVAVDVGEVVAEEPEIGEVEVFGPAIVEDDAAVAVVEEEEEEEEDAIIDASDSAASCRALGLVAGTVAAAAAAALA
jgi:hypothetical protein